MEKIKHLSTTSQNTQAETRYNCPICKDVGWIISENKGRRCECYIKEATVRAWKRFGVDPTTIKKIKDYDTDSPIQKIAKQKAIDYIQNFEEIRRQRNNSIAFLGQHGAGKSHLSLAIGKALFERKDHVEVVYMPYLEATKELKGNANDEEVYIKIQAKYLNCELLIVDDLFKDKVRNGKLIGQLTEVDMKHIYPIINQRYFNGKPTIYSSECDANMLNDLDGALAGRILESCKENIVIFKYSVENNYRLKNFM